MFEFLKLLPLQGVWLIAGLPRASALGQEFLPLQGEWGQTCDSSDLHLSLSLFLSFLIFHRKFQKFLVVSIKKCIFAADVALREKSSDSMFSDKLRFIYLSLPFFDKSEEECETGFEKWIYVLKYMEVLERLPFTAQKKIFDHLVKLADVRCLSSEEQEKYDESIKAVDDYYSGLYGSYIEGEEKGIAKGRVEVARNLLAMGMSWSQIMQATGLTEEELKQLH